MSRLCFFKGVRLWETFQEWDLPAARSDDAEFQGLRQARAGHNARSPNFARSVNVKCHVSPGSGHVDLDKGAALTLLQLQLDDELIGHADTKGDLSLAQGHDDRADLTGGPYPAGPSVDVTHSAFDSGWAPLVDRYVLIREPVTGKGWVTKIQFVGVGTLRLAEVKEEIDATWDMVYVQAVLPDALYVTTDMGNPSSAGNEEHWRPAVNYQFKTTAALLSAAAHAVPRGNS